MKIFKLPVLLLFCYGMVMANNLVTIEKTKPQIIFEPLGKLVTQFNYANIKIHLDLKPLKEEILDACNTALLLYSYLKEYKSKTAESSRKYLKGMQEDIFNTCIRCINKFNGISTTFGLKIEIESNPKKLKQILEKRNKNRNNKKERKRRQLVTLGVVAAISLISYYTLSQLTSIAGANDDDLISNQNHIVEAIQDDHNRLARAESDVKRLTKHIQELEKNLIILNDLETTYIKVLSIKSQVDNIENHISNIEIALYGLLQGRLSPSLLSTNSLIQTLNKLRNRLIKEGYTLGLEDTTDVIQSKSSFVSYEGGNICIIMHLPIFRTQTELSVYEYLDIPITTSHNKTAIIIQPNKPILAINLQNGLFVELSKHELKHDCQRIKAKYFCSNNAILTRPGAKSCLSSLFKQNDLDIQQNCNMKTSSFSEKIIQLNSTTFLIYTRNESQLYVTCKKHEEKIFEKQFVTNNVDYLTMKADCTALLEKNVIKSTLPVDYEVYQKITKINIKFGDIFGIGKSEMKEFSDFLEEKIKNDAKTWRITDIKKLYHITKLQKTSTSLWTNFKTFAYITGSLILFIIVISILTKVYNLLRPKPYIRHHDEGKLRVELSHITKKEELESFCETRGDKKSQETIQLPG